MIHDNFLHLFLGMQARGAGGVTLHISHLHQPATFDFYHRWNDIYRKIQGPRPHLFTLFRHYCQCGGHTTLLKDPCYIYTSQEKRVQGACFVVNIWHMCETENSSKNLLRLKYWWKRDGSWIFLHIPPSSRVSIVSQFFSKKRIIDSFIKDLSEHMKDFWQILFYEIWASIKQKSPRNVY